MTKFILTTVMLTGVAAIAAPSFADMALDVSPIRVQVRVEPGDEYTNAVRVLNSGKEPVRLRAYVEDWYLDERGTPIFRPAGTLERTASIWVDAAPADFLLEPGQAKFVRYTIKVPGNAREIGYHGSLLLETLPLDRAERKAMQMFVQGRIACMLYVTVGDPPKSAEIKSLAVVRRKDKPFLRVLVENTGEDFIRLAGDVKVVSGGEEVGERVPLPDVPVLPRARRYVELELMPGQILAHSLAQVRIELAGVGVLLGECSLDPEKVQLIDV
jgi:P pilus assembly chaperone PapD